MDNTITSCLKDNHDYRYDDADTLSENKRHDALPTHEQGKKIFLEQVPIILPLDSLSKPYRTFYIRKRLADLVIRRQRL